MGIKRYISTSDNTITNAFQEDFVTRGTGSNMGRSDVLEVFSIYEQAGTGSKADELSRVLIKFPTSVMATDRTNGILAASGSVKFFLNLYNAEHRQTTPQEFSLTINAVSSSWEEGYGLDMEGYEDLTHDKFGSNWINANNTFSKASATFSGLAALASDNATSLIITNADGTVATFATSGSDGRAASTATSIGTSDISSDAQATQALHVAFSAAIAAGTLNMTLTPTSWTNETTITLTQTEKGIAGNTKVTVPANISVQGDGSATTTWFSGGGGVWATQGGDYYLDTSSSFNQSFSVGTEDLSVDITTLVEQWINSGGNILGSKDDYGVLIKLDASYEASSSSNLTGSNRSYYTKKFFGRGSEFFFKRPCIEARWDSTRRDNRSNFYLSSSLADPNDVRNTLFMYNYVRGGLKDIAGQSTSLPVLKMYYASGSSPEGSALSLINSSEAATGSILATRVAQGVYKASFSILENVVTEVHPYLIDVWEHGQRAIHTGSTIYPKTFKFSNSNPSTGYVVSIPALKKEYSNSQTERFRVFIREKNWSPNVYTKVVATPEPYLVQSASYKVIRTADNKVVLNYGTSSTNHTVMSYDERGNYFDLDMSLFEPDYVYGLKFSFYEDSVSSYVEYPNTFKFRVIK